MIFFLKVFPNTLHNYLFFEKCVKYMWETVGYVNFIFSPSLAVRLVVCGADVGSDRVWSALADDGGVADVHSLVEGLEIQ